MQNSKHVKTPLEECYLWQGYRFQPASLLKVFYSKPLHECFSGVLNCTNGTKSRKAFHIQKNANINGCLPSQEILWGTSKLLRTASWKELKPSFQILICAIKVLRKFRYQIKHDSNKATEVVFFNFVTWCCWINFLLID